MRKNFILVVLVPLTIILLITFIFIESWIEYGIEYGGEKIIGAKVEVDDLNITLDPLGIEWNKIEVANPNDGWTNLFETGKVKFKMDPAQLIRGKYIIDSVAVEDFVIGTKRETDGSLSDAKKQSSVLYNTENSFSRLADEMLKQTIGENPVLDIDKLRHGFNADSLVAALDINTFAHIEKVKQQVNEAYAIWKNINEEFEQSKTRLKEIEKKITAIKPAELNNAPNIITAIAAVDDALKTTEQIENTFNTRYTSINNDINNLSNLVNSIDDAAESDFNKLKGMAKLPQLNTGGVARIIIGDEMYSRIMEYLGWADFARTNVRKYSPETEIEMTPRFEGQDINFPLEKGYPKFWIKDVLLSGGTDTTGQTQFFRARGEAKNISDNQSVTGLPLSISLDGTDSNKRGLKLTGLFDRTGDIPTDEYEVTLSGVALKEFKLGSAEFLPAKIINAKMESRTLVSIPGSDLDMQMNINLSDFTIEFSAATKSRVEKIVFDILKETRTLNFSLRLWNTSGQFQLALSTNIDNILSHSLTNVIGNEVAKLQNELKAKFNSVIAPQKAEFDNFYSEQVNHIQSQLGSYQSLLGNNQILVEGKKKELQAQLKKVEQGLGEKILDLLKGG
ncbi:TIGR03545 family protein [Bacteroidota bacterium]